MSVRTWWPLLIGCTLITACEPRTVVIPGLDELTAEIRSQRLLNRERAGAGGGSSNGTVEVRGAQIQLAMAPLRDVLTQLGTSQSELSGRQAALTQEMRRWTQLLVQSMQAERSDEASKLSKRLAELEKTITEQDQRHLKVEGMIGSALDHTADLLEQFLNQVGADTGAATSKTASPKGGGQPTPATGQTGTGEGKSAVTPKVPASTGAPAGPKKAAGGQAPGAMTPPTNGPPDGSTGKMASQQGSLVWLWGLAAMSLVSGFVLLFGKMRARPLAMKPETQFTPGQRSADDGQATTQTFTDAHPAAADQGVDDHETNELANGDFASMGQPHDQRPEEGIADGIDNHDKPEIEELWAAAALLGEAIGRLKQTDEPIPPELGGQQPLPETPDLERQQPEALQIGETDRREIDETDLGGVFVHGENDAVAAAKLAEPTALPTPESTNQIDILPHSLGHVPPQAATVIIAPSRDVISSQSAARDAASAPVMCRLHLSGDEQAEGRVRNILGRDPRILVSPAPQVRAGMGKLEVSYSLLPGLTAGECSLLEQQLRDTVT